MCFQEIPLKIPSAFSKNFTSFDSVPLGIPTENNSWDWQLLHIQFFLQFLRLSDLTTNFYSFIFIFAVEVFPKASLQIPFANISENLSKLFQGLLKNLQQNVSKTLCKKKMILPSVTLRMPTNIPHFVSYYSIRYSFRFWIFFSRNIFGDFFTNFSTNHSPTKKTIGKIS